ncbi:MAG: Na/Pi cotransporter family protein [Deltaproteobacteria bacterium]|nr:Na/Pi cotransporter family protein [Deltaproteobacteria bacterium]
MDLTNIIIQTVGGLGLFILGMKTMTEGLQATAGQRIRKILEAISANRFLGCATGAGVTAIVQSSSATTVMLIGFVGAGMMSLQQAVGVVLGANIGTTITGQLIAINLTKLALPAIALGVPMKFFSKKRHYRHIGDIILGFGLLFYGMVVMKNGLSPMRTDPQFISFFTKFTTDSLGGILLCISMGTILTIMVQSSSATVGLTMTLASQGLLDFPTAMALVLGENIGTTITAEIATIGSKNIGAHQTARAHTLFNVLGVSMIVLFFHPFVGFVQYVTSLLGAAPVDQKVNGEVVNMARYIANGHTLFNIVNASFFLLVLPKLIKVAVFLSPKKKKTTERYRLPQFDKSFIDSPIGALAKVKGEIIKTLEFTHMNLKKTSSCLQIRDDDILGEREAVEDHIDACQKVIIRYLTTVYQGEVNEPEAKEISEFMRITNNIERLGDSMENVAIMLEKIYDNDLGFSETAKNDLAVISSEVDKFVELILDELHEKTPGFYQKALAFEDTIDQMRENMRHQHIERLRSDDCSVDSGVFFISLVSSYEKMGDYCYNISTGVSRII